MKEQDILNEILEALSVAVRQDRYELIEALSKAYQRIKSVQSTNINIMN